MDFHFKKNMTGNIQKGTIALMGSALQYTNVYYFITFQYFSGQLAVSYYTGVYRIIKK